MVFHFFQEDKILPVINWIIKLYINQMILKVTKKKQSIFPRNHP